MPSTNPDLLPARSVTKEPRPRDQLPASQLGRVARGDRAGAAGVLPGRMAALSAANPASSVRAFEPPSTRAPSPPDQRVIPRQRQSALGRRAPAASAIVLPGRSRGRRGASVMLDRSTSHPADHLKGPAVPAGDGTSGWCWSARRCARCREPLVIVARVSGRRSARLVIADLPTPPDGRRRAGPTCLFAGWWPRAAGPT